MSVNKKSLEREFAEIEQTPSTATPDLALIPGKVYRGSFWVSEKGAITVKPTEEGKNPTGSVRVAEGDNFVLFKTKNLVRAVISVERSTRDEIRKVYKEAILDSYNELMKLNLE